jgi:CDP-diacylglycerol---glycerol-3-phosphate 3-phosphatidyltransferase
MNLPNKLTLTRIIMIPFFLLFIIPLPAKWETVAIISNFNNFIALYGRYIAGGIFIAAAFTDFLDGHIARTRKIVTNFGKFLDPIADKLLVAAALIALIQVAGLNVWFAFIILAREFFVSGIRLVAALEGKVIASSAWGKAKMMTQTIAILLIIFENFPFSLFTDLDVGGIMIIVAVITTIFSGYDYLRKNIEVIKVGR